MKTKSKQNGHFVCFAFVFFLSASSVSAQCVSLTSSLMYGLPVARWGGEVARLQEQLKNLGYFSGPQTGRFGSVTHTALRRFQKDELLYESGITDKETRDALYARCLAKPATSSKGNFLQDATKQFAWTFKGKQYSIDVPLRSALYEDYKRSEKSYRYVGELPDDWLDSFNRQFLTTKEGDMTFRHLANELDRLAKKEGLSGDLRIEFVLSFVQSIPYDHEQVVSATYNNYPYETLFTGKGVCADKTYLGYLLLRELGVGVAVFYYTDVKHAALGIKCSKEDGVHGTEYCYAETTSLLPIGAIPSSFNSNGVVANSSATSSLDRIFETDHLGIVYVSQMREGSSYGGVNQLRQSVTRLRDIKTTTTRQKESIKEKEQFVSSLEQKIKDERSLLLLTSDIASYNAKVRSYNLLLENYRSVFAHYKEEVDNYNKQIAEYNVLLQKLSTAK